MNDIAAVGVKPAGASVHPEDAAQAPLLVPDQRQAAALLPGPPILIVAIDTEAEFDWQGPFLRTHTDVGNLRNQALAQNVFDRFGVRPIYLVDYAVATKPDGYLPLREIAASGRCEIGAHLHPWITPPIDEELSAQNSFSQNLPASLQRDKLACLTDAITANFGIAPVSYRAGRYGVGDATAETLASLFYQIDMSVRPGIDMRPLHGPDFRRSIDRPYWFGRGGCLLEIPATPGFTGLLAHPALPRRLAIELFNRLYNPALDRFHVRGILAGLRMLDETPLSPEGVALGELSRLTQTLLARGHRTFVFSYHSSSLLPGSTQYVQSAHDLSVFLRTIEQYLEFFIGELGGVAMTPSEFRAALLHEAGGAACRSPTNMAAQ
jgi:hypothetical protein